MKQLNRWQSAAFLVGGALMVVGAGCFVTGFMQHVACWVFLVGAVMFTLMQSMQTYEGRNIAIRRLRRIMLLSDVLLIVSALLMYASDGNPFQFDQITYVQYIGNNWVVALLIAALLQLYTTFRISKELEKES
jgi:hypothetical protein